jgi:hypothetical protein
MPSSKGKPTDPKLREKVKEEVKNKPNSDGGGKGQWSAWKVQYTSAESSTTDLIESRLRNFRRNMKHAAERMRTRGDPRMNRRRELQSPNRIRRKKRR